MKRSGDILLVSLILAWVLLAGIGFFRLPFYGFATNPRGVVTEVAAGSLLRPGDRVVAVGGRRLTEHPEPTRLLRESGGRPLDLTVQRAAERLRIRQPSVPIPRSVWAQQLGRLLLALLFLGMGTLVALRRTGKPGQLFFLFCLAVAVQLVGPPQALGGEPWRRVAASAVWAALLFGSAVFLHFFLVFPQVHPLAVRLS
ncbi:MAG: hypothetical protein ABR599_01300 [Gemmatimonadota bacterium]